MKHFWIIDEEWPDYASETELLQHDHPGCEIRFSKELNTQDIEEFAPIADAVICQINIPIKGDLLSKMKNCKAVSVYGAGYNNVDVAAASELGIAVTNVPGYCAEDVADYVMAAIYRDNKRIDFYADKLAGGLWGAQAVEEKTRRISSYKLFIIGFGFIGQKLAAKAAGVGMSVMYYDAYPSAAMEQFAEQAGVRKVTIEEGLAEADIISVHMALTSETKNFFSDEVFAKMKPGVHFINASRGGVVDEAALIRAAKSKQVSLATLDVLVNEPPKADDPILGVPNICVTPHISYLSQDSLQELQIRAAKNASNIVLGKEIPEIVNKTRKA